MPSTIPASINDVLNDALTDALGQAKPHYAYLSHRVWLGQDELGKIQRNLTEEW